jgi:uncharacterized Zn-finger protein
LANPRLMVLYMSKKIELKASELNSLGGVHCPPSNTPSWSSHPKVFIDIAKQGQGRCHYCGTVYQLIAGEASSNHH